jgi:PmbA protein
MKSDILDSVISQAKNRCDAFELYARDSNGLSASYDKGKFRTFEKEAFLGASIRAVKDGRIGFATGAGPSGTATILDSALSIAPWGGELDYTFSPKSAATNSDPYDPEIERVTPSDMEELGHFARDLMKSLAPDGSYVGAISCSHGNARIVTSEGQDIARRGTSAAFYAGAELISEGDFLTIYDSIASNRRITKAEIEASVRRAAAEFADARTVAPLKAGTYRVLFTPRCMSDILTPIKVSVNGTNVDKKISRWGEALGTRVLDSRITITDDPAHPDGTGSGAYDGEGMPTVRRKIIDAGTLTGFIHSRMTAAHCGHQPTGNGQRGVETIAKPGFHNFIVDAGDASLEDQMRELGNGLMVDTLIGSFTSNFLAGQCSGGILIGYLVRDGKRVGRVKNAAINVNTFDLLNGSLVSLSKERKWCGGAQLMPYALVDGVAVSAR